MTDRGQAATLRAVSQQLTVGITLTTEPDRSRPVLENFCEQLSAATGIAVKMHGIWPYHHLLQALSEGEIDLVWLPPLLALRATASGACSPIALPVRQGTSTFSAALFTRAEGELTSLDQLRDCRAGWVDKQSTAGYLIVRAALRQRGIELSQAFSKELFLGTHKAVVQAVMEGAVDVGSTFAYFPEREGTPVTMAGWGDADVRVLCRVDGIPSDLFAAGRGVPAELQRRVQKALVEDQNQALMDACVGMMGARAFAAPTEEHLEALVKLLAELDTQPSSSRTSLPPKP